jgi:hypothetical protein
MKSKIIASTLLGIGFLIGATALSALAVWTAPTETPPTCTAGLPGCDAPINVGGTVANQTSWQTKTGPLTLLHLITSDFNFLPFTGSVSNPPTAGQVLMADNTNASTLAAGKVKWGDVSGVGANTGLVYLMGGEYDQGTFKIPPKLLNESDYKYTIVADVHGGQSAEAIYLDVNGVRVAQEGSLPTGFQHLSQANHRLQFNINYDVSKIKLSWDCLGETCNNPAAVYYVWIYRTKDVLGYSFPGVEFTYNIP